MSEKLLVIHQGAIGDVVLSFPALVSLEQQRDTSVALLCSSQPGKIAHELNVVDAHFSLESARFCSLFSEEMTPAAKKFINNYDPVIFIGFSEAIERNLTQNHAGNVYKISPRPPVEEETHVTLYVMRQMQAKGLLRNTSDIHPRRCSVDECGLQIADCGTWKSKIRHEVKPASIRKEDLIIIHPGAGSPRKRWPAENFIRVATAVKEMKLADVIFVVGPAEPDLAPLIRAESNGSFLVHELCDSSRLIALLRQARCFIGNDCGATHLAAFMRTPTLAVFGPSSPKRWAPIGHATRVLRGTADCAPCFEIADTNCEDPQCLNGVSVDMVVSAVKGLSIP